ncbi:MAG: zinc ABC transporter substrate-binding protein [Candidatus Sericytochromatia bacterium]|nr:zinc ABC transporter substrate-binding protein [Candidatus Sericytochromatia bacterium]
MIKKILATFVFLLIAVPAFADVNVITAYPYIKDIAERIGKDKIKVTSLASGNWDPHFIIPKPSLIAKARKADLLIINGGQLEIGWLPQIIRQSNNPNIQSGNKGLLDLSNYVKMMEVPTSVSRSQGDVHPNGNPHFVLDPYNVPKLSKAISEKLSIMDSANSNFYKNNNIAFTKEWMLKLKGWSNKMKPFSGTKVFEYHRLYDYFLARFHLVYDGALEPLPGIPPTAKHLEDLINIAKKDNVKFILQDVYHPKEASKFISEKTGVKVIVMPQDVNAVVEAKDIFSLFDNLVNKITG